MAKSYTITFFNEAEEVYAAAPLNSPPIENILFSSYAVQVAETSFSSESRTPSFHTRILPPGCALTMIV